MTPAIFGCSGPELTPDERAFFRDADPAGYILFGRNCVDRVQLRRLTDDLRSIHGRDRLLVSIDQEGGRVARLRPPHWSAYPSGRALADLYDIAPASAIVAARSNAEAMGLELSAMGITVTYHPPLDLLHPGAHSVIGDRALGSEPMQVAALGRAILDGLHAGGVSGCIKHMPGHGRSTVDTHEEMPTVHASPDELERDLAPFKALSQARIGMTGHLLFPCWDGERVSTFSPTIVQDIIRETIGFGGLLLSDDIDMNALSGTIPERSAKAHAAGCDIVLNCWANMADMQGICEVLPAMSKVISDRLERAIELTGMIDSIPDAHRELLARRDALLALKDAA